MKSLKHLDEKLNYQYEAMTKRMEEILKINNDLIKANENLITMIGNPTIEEIDLLNISDMIKKRNILLKKSDVYLLSDFPKGDVTIEQIETYRQELRDLPSQEGYPDEVIFPINPLEQ